MPALLPTLELGASRFYHSPFRDGAHRWQSWTKSFEGFFKQGFGSRNGGSNDPTGDIDNQLASLFARWTFPSRGAEAAFELLREDHNWDARDLAQEPDNNSAVLASIRVLTERRSDRLSSLTLEYFDGDVRPIAQARSQGYLYLNGGIRQGHTQRGQLLGAPIGAGAIAGERAAWERFGADGSLRVQLQRWRTQSLRSDDPEALFRAPERLLANSHDWIVDASVLATRLRGLHALSVEGGVAWAGVWQFDGPMTNLYVRCNWTRF